MTKAHFVGKHWLGPSAGGDPPATPTLALADDGNGSTVTATISGSLAGTTNRVYFAIWAGEWGTLDYALGNTRTGDGTVSLTTGTGRVMAYCESTRADGLRSYSAVAQVVVETSGAATPTLLSELRTYLRAGASIASTVADRVRPRKMEQDEQLPAIRLAVVSGASEEHLAGAAELAHATVQIDAYDDDSETADDLAELIRVRLQGHRGMLSTVWANGISVEGDLRQHEEPIDDGGTTFRYVSSRDYRVSYKQG